MPYKAFPTNEPSGPPPDYFHLDVSPGMFGAHIGKGLQQAGEGINKAADTWGEIQKDDVLNNAIKEASEATEEYSKLRGADALNGEQGIKDQLTQINDKYRSQLPPGLAHQFDQQFRPYRDRYLAGKISTHAISQGYDYSKTVNTTAQDLALNHAARNYNNPAEVENAIHDMRDASMKQLQLDGRAGDPNTVTEYMRTSDASVYKAAAEAQFQHDPAGALQYVEQHKKELGVAYAPLYNQFRARATEIQSEQGADVVRKAIDIGYGNPTAARGILDANRASIGEEAYQRAITVLEQGKPKPGSNVVQFPGSRPGESEPDRLVREAKEKVEGKTQPENRGPVANPTPRRPGESPEDWLKRHQSQNYSPAQKMSADYPPGLPFTSGAKAQSEGQGAIDAALQHTVNAHADRNFFSSGAARRQGIPLDRTTIGDSQGHTIEVNAAAAPHFSGFLKELADSGYKIKDIGGYSNRKIFGTSTYSEHAFGNAIDINPNQNPQMHGGPSNMPANIREMAAKYGLIWGGDWTGSSRDPMHFEWSGKGTQVAGR